MVALVAANLYVIFFNVSWGPVMWVMLGEMFPNQIRGSALAVAGFAQWFANYLIAQTFPVMAGLEPRRDYHLLRVSAVISFFLVQKLIHETAARSWSRWKADWILGADFLPRPNVFGASY